MAAERDRDKETGHFVKGNQARYKHGITPLERQGAAALDEEGEASLLEIEAHLDAPDGVREVLRRRCAMGLVILQTLETYIAEQIAEGVPMDKIPIALRWPGFQNSVVRALAALKKLEPEQETKNVTEILRGGNGED
jgi:hypothetical protein